MAGRVHTLIRELLVVRADGNPAVERFLRIHLICKGIHPDKFDERSADDPEMVAKLEEMLRDFGE